MNSQDYKGYYSKSSSKSCSANKDYYTKNSHKNKKINKNIKETVKKTIKISSNTNLYSAGELEKYYNELVSDVQKEVFNNGDECESIENECYAKICYDFAMIARLAYFYVSKKFANNKSNEEIKGEINNLCYKNNYSKYSNILTDYCMGKTLKFSNYMNKNERNDFFCRLIRVYLFCKLLNCKVDFNSSIINCDYSNDDSNKMRDFINSGLKQKRVNFIILPSILYNGYYIGNFSQVVFTYGKRVGRKTKKSELTCCFSDEKVKLLDKILLG